MNLNLQRMINPRSLLKMGMRIVNVVFPRVCTVCHTPLVDGEDLMCLNCQLELPRIDSTSFTDNEITDRLVSLRGPLCKATSLYYYVSGTPYVRLIHDAKYNRRPIVGKKLAYRHSSELLKKGFFDGIDLIVPIPIHYTKLWRRGYNQSYEIACGISEATGIPVSESLVATKPHSTQTRKTAMQRRHNAIGAFMVKEPVELVDRHILVVDDVITTGSTILAGVESIHRASPTAMLSVYSLGLSKMK